MFSQQEIRNELNHIYNYYEFSYDCPDELKEHLETEGLIDIELESDTPILTLAGELAIGIDKEDLKEQYGDDYDYT